MITRLTTLTTTQKTYSSKPVISTRSTGLKRRKEWKRGRECPKLKIAFSGLDSHLNRIFSLINQLTVFSFTHDIGKLFIFVLAEQSPCSVFKYQSTCGHTLHRPISWHDFTSLHNLTAFKKLFSPLFFHATKFSIFCSGSFGEFEFFVSNVHLVVLCFCQLVNLFTSQIVL